MGDAINTLKVLELREAEFKALADNAPVWIIRIDTEGIIEYINHVLPEYNREDVIGDSVYNYISPESKAIYRKNIEAAILTGETKFFDLESTEIGGGRLNYEVHMAPIKTNLDINGLVVISTDVTEKTRIKENLEKALREKESLLKEVHHRAKNNLQIISSILNLHSKKTDNEKTLNILAECKNSIQSLALVHECLYQSNDFSKISLDDYIARFCYHFNNSMLSGQSEIKLETKLEPAFTSMDKAITCGLIINELLVNAYKHAFPDKKGTIIVGLSNDGEKLRLSIADNGIGISKEILADKSTFGFDLLEVMVEQLGGDLITQSTPQTGTSHIITCLCSPREK